MRNALDWVSRPRGNAVLEGKPVGTASASPSPHGAAWAQHSLHRVLTVIGADVVREELAVSHAFRQFDHVSRLADGELRARLGELVERSYATPTPGA
ncbi:NADPH-dependent FMN reductase [Kribbella sp. NPDC050124]|uniref:NADPH-dependent FMN reductase n=1 Tax=Kribbella sp. NPDC050124 TaxID=3364114 RepID=UPI0037BD096F